MIPPPLACVVALAVVDAPDVLPAASRAFSCRRASSSAAARRAAVGGSTTTRREFQLYYWAWALEAAAMSAVATKNDFIIMCMLALNNINEPSYGACYLPSTLTIASMIGTLKFFSS